MNVRYFNDTKFEAPVRFNLIETAGHGRYGFVVGATDTLTNRMVAIKKHTNITSHKTFCRNLLRELDMQKVLRGASQAHILTVEFSYLRYQEESGSFDLYTVSQLMDFPLTNILSSKQPLQEEHCQYFIYQILRALAYLHSANIMHRDLKPENILVNKDCQLRVSDFGLARGYSEVIGTQFTQYVVTRYYRPPELLLMYPEYTMTVDTWSAGCVFAELFQRRALFAGQDFYHQLELIVQVLGTPKPQEYDYVVEDSARAFLENIPTCEPQRLLSVVPGLGSELAEDFLSKMLVFDYRARWTAQQLLEHPYLARFHSSPSPKADTLYNFEHDNEDLSIDSIIHMVHNLVDVFYDDGEH